MREDKLEACSKRSSVKILVVVVSYGYKNDQYLTRVLDVYRAMSYDVNVVVTSNIPKDLGADIEVIVGLPSKDPRSLGFASRKIFAERMDHYDVFIYVEDDILITEQNIDSFLDATGVLSADEIAGFVHAEEDPDGNLYFDPPHSSFHWDPSSVKKSGKYTLAQFTNVQSACCLLTQQQLRQAIASGGFSIEPHEGRYEMIESASNDLYTQCGFTKLVPVSHLEQFTVRHLPANKWAVMPYRASAEFYRQINALVSLEGTGRPKTLLFEPETKVLHRKWSKDYYERARKDVVSLIPDGVRTVLSIGCGWGETEGWLVNKGVRVVGIPMDSVIAACAEAKGVEIVYGDLDEARKRLEDETFDCLILSSVLHLVNDPVAVLSSYVELLVPGGIVLATAPNFAQVTTRWRRLKGAPHYRNLGNYATTGIHVTTPKVIREWFRRCRLTAARFAYVIPEKGLFLHRLSLGLARSLLGEEVICVGKRQQQIRDTAREVKAQLDAVLPEL
jgi:2-polyprenyl-3-methyl-5-hydroxy-6-metoxy-1,4-benzoquinol methylase